MPDSIEKLLKAALTAPFYFGEIFVQKTTSGRFVLSHRDDESVDHLQTFRNAQDAIEIAKYDDSGNYRLAIFAAWKRDQLQTTPLRETLDRQSGMYRVAAKISDSQIDDVVADFCRSNSGCLRTILWKRDARGTSPSTKLPDEKFDPTCDQTAASIPPGSATPATATTAATVPLLCQEACNLLVAECRKGVKGE